MFDDVHFHRTKEFGESSSAQILEIQTFRRLYLPLLISITDPDFPQSKCCFVKAALPSILELLTTNFKYGRGSVNYGYVQSLRALILNIYSQKCVPQINEEVEVSTRECTPAGFGWPSKRFKSNHCVVRRKKIYQIKLNPIVTRAKLVIPVINVLL